MAMVVTPTMQPVSSPPSALVDVTGIPVGAVTLRVWRSWASKRVQVRGGPFAAAGSIYGLTDYEVPFGVDVSWQVEAVDGSGGVLESAQTGLVQLAVDDCWLQDPVSPSVCTVASRVAAESFETIDYVVDGQVLPVAGAAEPVATAGVRRAGSNIPLRIYCADELEAAAVRVVMVSAVPVLLRWPASYQLPLPKLAYLYAPTVSDGLVSAIPGKSTISCTVDVVAPPAAAVAVPTRTYNDLLAEASTYSDVLTQRATYLEVLRG